MLELTGRINKDRKLDLEKDKFKEAANHAYGLIKDRERIPNRPSLPPWVSLVCVAPVCPHGITCSRPRKV